MLSKSNFIQIIKNTPLISIDLIIENEEGKILLGKRVNEPAKNEWFVPGGRIFKDETLDTAFSRTTTSEIGITLERKEVNFYGLYEHFYENNVFNNAFSTHYIVLAHKFKVKEKEIKLNNQHEKYQWFTISEILEKNNVNQYTKDYFL
jgi:colanic acid biosynthesis protein WcaH